LWVNRVVLATSQPLPVQPDQRTSADLSGMSQKCQEATSITDGGSVSGDRKLKKSTPRLAPGRPQPPTMGFDNRAADREAHAHDLRTRHAGRMMFIDFHLVVPGSMSVNAAHDICDRIEKAVKEEFPDALISIHVEPDDRAKHSGIVVL
jgi:hypothetical protein